VSLAVRLGVEPDQQGGIADNALEQFAERRPGELA
jgi:hypothetical protein